MKTSLFLVVSVLGGGNFTAGKPATAVATALKPVAQPTPAKHSRRFWRDRLTGRRYPLPDSIGGRPASWYLANSRVSALAKALYSGRFRPSDTDSTTRLLSLATTNEKEIRPFYRWCLDFTILLSDGALGEYPGKPALAYATKYPQEFFAYMDKDASGQRYKRWVEVMGYSGLSKYPATSPNVKRELIASLKRSCQPCSPLINRRLSALAKDIAAVATRGSQ